MFIAFFMLWLVFNGRVTVEIVCFGLALSGLAWLFAYAFLGYRPRDEWRAARKLGLVIRYGALLVGEIIKAALAVLRLILSTRYEVEPGLVRFKSPVKSEGARVVLANSITLTPGTITVTLEDDEYCVHCLDRDMGEGLEDGPMVKLLQRMEAMD